ncbi:hypothetical protein D3C74_374270 [compost metagenome]
MQLTLAVKEAEEQRIYKSIAVSHTAGHSNNIKNDLALLPPAVFAARCISAVDILAHDPFQPAALRSGEQFGGTGVAWHVLNMGMREQHFA